MEKRHRHLGAALGVVLILGGWASADEKGETILRKAFTKLHAAKNFSANVTVTMKDGPTPAVMKGTVAASKPNLFRWELNGKGAPTFVADGTDYYQTNEGGPYFFKSPLPKEPKEMMGMWEGEVDAFFGGPSKVATLKTSFVGVETIEGQPHDVVKAVYTSPVRTVVYTVSQKDSIIRRAELRMPLPDGKESVQINELTNVRLNGPIDSAVFAWKAPSGQKLYERPDFNAKLVKVGEPAPDFSLPGPNGETVSLAEALKGKKALLVNFWFYG